MSGIAMATIVLGCAFLILLVNYLRLRHSVRKGKEALVATIADCEAGELFVWLAEHEDAPLDHPECQRLLRRKVEAYREFLHTHPNCRTNDHDDLACLESLLAQ